MFPVEEYACSVEDYGGKQTGPKILIHERRKTCEDKTECMAIQFQNE